MTRPSTQALRAGGLALAIAVLSGCAQRAPADLPTMDLPAGFKQGAGAAAASPALQVRWWEVFGDEDLNRLQEQLQVRSPDLAAALARHDQAEAVATAARSAQSPSWGASLSAQRLRQSERRPLRVLGPNSPDRYDNSTAQLDLSYELDLWGRVRQRVAAGDAELRAADADLQGALLSLQSQLADTWMALRGADAELVLLQDSIGSYEKAVALTSARRQQGIASGLDRERAQGQLESIRSQLMQARARRAQLENAVAVLVGAHPSSFGILPTPAAFRMPAIPAGLPSALLERRPDIRAAQQRVQAAAASVGVARAAFFPTLTLSAQGGLQSSDLGRFLEAPNLFWAVGPGLVATLFDGGRRRADQARAEAVLDEAGQRYRSVVLGAFQQVEDQLALLAHHADAADSERRAAASATAALEMAVSRYREGAAGYLEVVTAQIAQLQARRSELDLLTRQRRAGVQLIRALGGGWSAAGDPDRGTQGLVPGEPTDEPAPAGAPRAAPSEVLSTLVARRGAREPAVPPTTKDRP